MKPINPLFLKIDELLLDNPEHYFTYQEILEAYTGRKFKKTARETDTVKGHPCHQTLMDAMKLIKKQLKEQGLALDYKNGKDAQDGFRYPRGVADPMWRKKTNHRQIRSEQLKRLVDASVGLFPASWLADFIAGAQSLYADDDKCIIFDQNPHLAHIQWVPTFFDAIEKHQVVRFSYNPKYGEETIELQFHPHYLKEYNQRWFVFGRATDLTGHNLQYSNCPIDRIVSEVTVCESVDYIPAQKKNFAATYFKDIVGVNRPKNKAPQEIRIATNDAITHGRIMTKPIHAKSQLEVEAFGLGTDRRGIISFRVIPNDELDTLLMSYGAGIEVLSPEEYRNHFARKVKALGSLYFDQDSIEDEG